MAAAGVARLPASGAGLGVFSADRSPTGPPHPEAGAIHDDRTPPHTIASGRSTAARTTPGGDRHVVDQLIAERAPRLAASPAWPAIAALLGPLLKDRAARRMADAVADLEGAAALDHVSGLLRLDARASGLERVPRSGACLVVANHPTGIADGIALYDVLRPVRPDVAFFANADALRVCPGLAEVLIPVVWPSERRTLGTSRTTLRRAHTAFGEGRAVVVFPAGALARRVRGVLLDLPWEHSAVMLARRHGVPLVPAHVAGPFPRLFHLFDRVSRELRDITLFHELMNKAGARYDVRFGWPVDAGHLEGSDEVVSARLKTYVERVLPIAPDTPFEAVSVAPDRPPGARAPPGPARHGPR